MSDTAYGVICAAFGSFATVAVSVILLWLKNRNDFFGNLTKSEKDDD